MFSHWLAFTKVDTLEMPSSKLQNAYYNSLISNNSMHTMPIKGCRVDTMIERKLVSRMADTRLCIRHSAVTEAAQ